MKAVSMKISKIRTDGTREVEAVILSDTAPAVLPTSGAEVEGMADTDTFAPFSLLFVVEDADTKIYIANESGVFVAQ